MALNFRKYLPFAVPSWLSNGDGGKLLHVIGTMLDVAVQRARDGLEARFPTRAGPSALSLIGPMRGILQGRSETDQHYAQRLVKWRYPLGHRVRGNAFSLLDQIAEYWGGVRCWTIDINNTWHGRGVASYTSLVFDRDAESYRYDAGLNFGTWYEFENPAVNWARFWVVINANPQLPDVTETPDYGDPALWGGAAGTPGYCIGLSGWTPDDTLAMRKLFRSPHAWRPGGTAPEWLLVGLEDWASVVPNPDETWQHWSTNVAGTQTPSRDTRFRYISLTPEANNTYAGKPANFCDDFVEAGGGTYAGNPASFPTVVLPDGSPYIGNPARFPTSFQMIDDGDPVK